MFFRKTTIRTLDDVFDWGIRNIAKGASSFRHPFHIPVLATVNGGRPEARTVILRRFSKIDRTLTCHCDSRTPKVTQIRENSRVSWHFYDPKEWIQLRLSGTAAVHTDDGTADAEWAKVRRTSRINYSAEIAPGSPASSSSSGLPALLRGKAVQLADSSAARKNFGVIVCRFDEMDWLMLKLGGNRRARFRWAGERVVASWVIP